MSPSLRAWLLLGTFCGACCRWDHEPWAADLFDATTAPHRPLVLRGVDQLASCGAAGSRLRSKATQIADYQIRHETGAAVPQLETFHAKIVLADGVAAYVGSANFLYRSREANLECGFLLEGDAVAPVAVLVEAVLRAVGCADATG